MSSRYSHKDAKVDLSSDRTTFERLNGFCKGWIDLEKRPVFILLAAITLSAFSALGAFNYFSIPPKAPQTSRARTAESSLFIAPGVAGSEIKLSKEYLYAQSEVIAVEDGGATSVPQADLAVWRPSTGTWITKAGRDSRQVTVQVGEATDIPAVGDYDGDGKTDFCVFRQTEGRWYLLKSSTNNSSSIFAFGGNGDIPVPADFDGDGKTDFAVWRPSYGIWYVRKSTDNRTSLTRLGYRGDIPSPNDYDGDGKADFAVWRPSTRSFYSINTSDGKSRVMKMDTSGSPVTGDYDGDGYADFAIRKGSIWNILKSSENKPTRVSWQRDSDLAVPNDYDGDGTVDIATWRPSDGRWFIRQSSNLKTRTDLWGKKGDVPVPALYRR